MALHIRDPQAAALARKLAARRRQTMTEAVIGALKNELKREAERLPLARRLDTIALALAAKGDATKGRRPTKREIDALWCND